MRVWGYDKGETRKLIYGVFVKLFQFPSFKVFFKEHPSHVTFKYLQKIKKKKKLGTVQMLCPFFFIKMIPFIFSQGKQRSHQVSINLVSPILVLISPTIQRLLMQSIWIKRVHIDWQFFHFCCCQELIFSLPGFTGFVFAQILNHQRTV